MPAIKTDRSTMHLTQALLASRGWKLGLFVFCILGMNFSGTWIAAQLDLQIWPQHGDVIELVIVSMVVAFVIAMATPFVPGIEIGLALMLLLGPGGIVMVYLCTQLSLALSFLLGTTIRPRYLSSICRWLQFEQASQLLTELDRTPPELRMWRLARRSNSRGTLSRPRTCSDPQSTRQCRARRRWWHRHGRRNESRLFFSPVSCPDGDFHNAGTGISVRDRRRLNRAWITPLTLPDLIYACTIAPRLVDLTPNGKWISVLRIFSEHTHITEENEPNRFG